MAELEQVKPKYNGNLNVVQANELVRSKQDELTLLEAKIIRLAIAQILQRDTDLQTYSVEISRLAKLLKMSNDNIYREVKTISSSLIKKSICITDGTKDKNGNQNYKMFHWVDMIGYNDGILTFKLSESLKPYLIGLNELFTKYEYAEVLSLNSNNAIRLYELLSSYENLTQQKYIFTPWTDIKLEQGEVIFTIEFLREFFNCTDKYKDNTGDFMRRAIDSSVQAINKKTLMQVSYRVIKTGRSIAYVIFKIGDVTEKPIDVIRKIAGTEYKG